jgi:hypothetical protein
LHADLTTNPAAMRDSARFHFGFTVPFVAHTGAAGVVAAVSESRGDLGLINAMAGSGAWWAALEFDSAPKIIARLPFVDRDDHPAALPVFVISRVAPDAMVPEVCVWSVRVSGWGPKAAKAVARMAEVVAVPDSAFDGAALLVSVPQGLSFDRIADAIVNAGASIRSSALVGSHATRYTLPAAGAGPVESGR